MVTPGAAVSHRGGGVSGKDLRPADDDLPGPEEAPAAPVDWPGPTAKDEELLLEALNDASSPPWWPRESEPGLRRLAAAQPRSSAPPNDGGPASGR